MLTQKLLAAVGLAGALLLGVTSDASANPRQGPVYRTPVVAAPVYRAPDYAPIPRVPVSGPVYAPPVYGPVYTPPPVYRGVYWRQHHWGHHHGRWGYRW